MLAFFGSAIEYNNWDIMLQLYLTLVRLYLACYLQFKSPYNRKDVIAIESIEESHQDVAWSGELNIRRDWINGVNYHWKQEVV